ncbi:MULTISPECIES: DUF2691 family protein [Clostridium]|uniref:DUF2691 family protein n=1 Tax=Clostridium TaxID=1485 RepID=UPI0009C1524B|nr:MULTISPECIES: DUF2691 family protein [Clostridium]PJI07259.1 DUF2691 domain-containing protein [Clostridium sp. CT7]
MRGISFKTKESYGNILCGILFGIDANKFCWYISEDEIYDEKDKPIFEKGYVDGATFLRKIQEKSYMVMFANIKAYPSGCKPIDVKNYDEFVKSKCELVILCSDLYYYEIYAKDTLMIETIKNNAIKNGMYDIEYITKENDGRTVFSVL